MAERPPRPNTRDGTGLKRHIDVDVRQLRAPIVQVRAENMRLRADNNRRREPVTGIRRWSKVAGMILGVMVVLLLLVRLANRGSGFDDRTDDPPAPGATGLTQTIRVVGTNALRFEPEMFAVPAGEPVLVELTADAVEHDFTIEGAADVGTTRGAAGERATRDSIPAGDLHVVEAEPGQTLTAGFAIDVPGSYTVYCAVPGHREAGMVATLEVVPSRG